MAEKKRFVSRAIRDVEIPVPPRPKKKLDIDALLTPEKKEELSKEAEARVLDREAKAAEAEYLQQQIDAFDKLRHPEIVEEYKEITLRMAPHMEVILLDGTQYVRNETYTVSKRVYDTMQDIIWQGFKHDDEIQNRSKQQRKERNLSISAREGIPMIDGDGKPAVKF